jgi:hypothetical protein
MTKILDTKQIIHIVSEIVVLIGMAFWFSQSNKKLKSYVDNLERRLDAQEETIKRHEHHLAKIIETMQNGQPSQDQLRSQIEAQMKAQMKAQTQMQAQMQAQQKTSRPSKVRFVDQVVSKPETVEIHEIEEEEEEEMRDERQDEADSKEDDSDTALDEEILEELAELENCGTDIHLKKR